MLIIQIFVILRSCALRKFNINATMIVNIKLAQCLIKTTKIWILSNSYTMGCPPVSGDNPRALASGLSYVQADNPWYNYFIPPTSV